ncbi:unnamed protein product [Echinostoma caproni]|uniref:Transposase n=1 Tax=Echinostoma caproni TaxID=27848 RepID=A0A183BAA2_9TREM|nr:unnamed protein product [Echinostoma caproni]
MFSQLLDTKSALSQSAEAWRSTDGKQRSRFIAALLQASDELSCLSDHLTKLATGHKPDLASLLFEPQPTSRWLDAVTECDASALPTDRTGAFLIIQFSSYIH